MLSEEILTKIVLFTGEFGVLSVFMDAGLLPTTGPIMNMGSRILIQGQVQSGKTAAIMEVLQNPIYKKYRKVLVIQNSLCVLQQYSDRMTNADIDFQIITSKTAAIHSDIVIVMRNKYRMNAYLEVCGDSPFIGIIDEYDQAPIPAFMKNAYVQYCVSATHRPRRYKDYFQRVIQLPIPQDYYGFNRLNIIPLVEPLHLKTIGDARFSNFVSAVNTFIHDTDNGMMLINHVISVKNMHSLSAHLSYLFPDIPIVVLSTKKTIRVGGVLSNMKRGPLSKTIDSLNSYTRIIFIANILSLRGLSYTSSDFSRHLTHQYSKLTLKNYSSIIQRMRIFGKYSDSDARIHIILDDADIRILPRVIKASSKNIKPAETFQCLLLN